MSEPAPDDRSPDTLTYEPPPPGVRWLLFGSGFLCVGLGAVGAFLPVLPTTPFLLLAAACFARSSKRWHDWLLGNRLFGPAILDYRRHRAIRPGTRWTAIALVVVTLGSSILVVPYVWLKGMLVGIGICVITLLLSLKTLTDEQRRADSSSGDSA